MSVRGNHRLDLPGVPPIAEASTDPPRTPDGRYIVVRGRLWRATNPRLPEEHRLTLVAALMDARRAVQRARLSGDATALSMARGAVNNAKLGLGERGLPWWDDGQPDMNRRMAHNTQYADWYAKLEEGEGDRPLPK